MWHRLWPWPKGHATRMATLCERRWEITQIKQMVTCCLDAVAHGGNHGNSEWGEPPLAALPPQDRAASLIKKHRSSSVAQALALAKRPRYANGHAVRTTLGASSLADS
ncbi:MAG: hypothetical protein F6K26_45600 [Moorea sp. SIO2I5]|nr:hypothetical protein [Moorena sp. SIO2I5]